MNILETIKANKKVIIKRALIAGAVVTTVIVVGALYKANVNAQDALEVAADAVAE